MSKRGTKRAVGVRADEAGTSKRRKTDPEDALWNIRQNTDLKLSSIYNRGVPEAPAELFRKDLISAMKLPDSEPLAGHDYWVITDTWKQEWERGVQVPVNPDSLPAPEVEEISNPLPFNFQDFKLPKNKYIHLTRDATYQSDIHHLSNVSARAEAACAYDLDATDAAWLKVLNGERARAGAPAITESQLEKVIEELEVRCWDKIQHIIKSEDTQGIEYDENVICDVCRSPDSEDGNEMVFCDACNICVHQACYGITTIPSGSWLCKPCGEGDRPTCVLCPNSGGAMKCTPAGNKWAHVSCVLWIPEVSIGCAEKMEPITKISAIPQSRWSLVCVLCKEKKGACIQCSVKTCKTAYHVTCAFKHGLEMRAIIEDESADDGVKLRSYCQKHSVNSKKDKNAGSGSEEDEVKRKRRKDMTSEEKNQARIARLHEIEGEFDKHVSVKDISTHLLDVDQDAITYIYNYWKLKRRAAHNRPLLPPKTDDSDLLSHRQEQADLDKMKMFVQLRQDLERVRNLCYMVSRREKLSRSFFRMREQTFHKQVAVLEASDELSNQTQQAVIQANHGPSIYDKLYSHANAQDNMDFETMLKRIACVDNEKKKDINGLVKSSKTQYKKVLNGSARRAASIYSGLSSEESSVEVNRPSKNRNRTFDSTTDDEVKHSQTLKRKAGFPKERRKTVDRKRSTQKTRTKHDSSTEEEEKPSLKKEITSPRAAAKKEITSPRGVALLKMEKEMSPRRSGTDSDELMISSVRSARKYKFTTDIYSDSSDEKVEDFNDGKSPGTTNDSQHQLPRTKAAMKEFVPSGKGGESRSPKKEKKGLDDSKDSDSKFTKEASDLIVPQRKAAKKASENMRGSSKTGTKDPTDLVSEKENNDKIKPKPRGRPRENKEAKIDNITKKQTSTDSTELDKEEKESTDLFPYVPQRQAAKKAAAHIKSGLGTKFPTIETSEETKKKEVEKQENLKKKEENKISKSPSKSSSSSSTSSSSSSYSSSSSSEEDNKSPKAQTKDSSVNRENRGLPFQDKVSRTLFTSSSSSDTESEKEVEMSLRKGKPSRRTSDTLESSPRKAPDKKFKTSERRPDRGATTPQRKEPRGDEEARASTRTRTRSITSSGNMPDYKYSGQRKPRRESNESLFSKAPKETRKPGQFSTSEWKADETIKSSTEKSDSKFNESKSSLVNSSEKVSSSKKKVSQQLEVNSPSQKEIKKDLYNDENENTKILLDHKTKENFETKTSSKPSPDKSISSSIPKDLNSDIDKYNYKSQSEKFQENISFRAIENRVAQRDLSVEDYSRNDESNATSGKQASPSKNSHVSDQNHHKESKIKAVQKRSAAHSGPRSEDTHSKTKQKSSYQNRSIFSPQPNIKDNTGCDLTEFEQDILAVDDSVNEGFNNEDHLKPFSFGPDFFFKEDSKEDHGVQETLNLVEKLRRDLNHKKPAPNEICEKEALNIECESENVEITETYTPIEITDNVKLGYTDKRPIADHTALNYISNDNAHDKQMYDTVPNMSDETTSSRHVEVGSSEKWLSTSSEHTASKLSVDDSTPKELVAVPTTFNLQEMTNKTLIENSSVRAMDQYDEIEKSKGEPDNISVQSSGSQELTDVRSLQNYDNNNSLSQGDCMSVHSSYTRESAEMKWGESKITHRRSSESSIDSEDSANSISQATEKVDPMPVVYQSQVPFPHNLPYSTYQNDHYAPVPLYSTGTNSDNFQPNMSSQYLSKPLTLPNAMSTGSSFSHLCTAAFTTSSHNIALTAAVVAPPTPRPTTDEAIEETEQASEKAMTPFSHENLQAPTSTDIESSISPKTAIDSFDKNKHPHKSFKSTGKVVKSPVKSTSKSPKQTEPNKVATNRKPPSKPNRNHRGRGRTKARGAVHGYGMDNYGGNSIHSKLVGTVYDFDDDEIANDSVDLKSLRERRPSIDIHDKKPETVIIKEASNSPHMPSPSSKRAAPIKELKPPSPILEEPVKPPSPVPVLPVLPGPVDMRTYQSCETDTKLGEAYNSHLLEQFAIGPNERNIADIDDDIENELQSVLLSNNEEPKNVKENIKDEIELVKKSPAKPESPLPKITQSDSRNQLKVKIKGPFLDANYSASSIAPVVPIPPVVTPLTLGPPSAVGSVNPANLSGVSSLRRMRKKELLRQYWTQNANADDPGCNINTDIVVPPVAPSPLSRTIITIPKAVASMTTFPTREDYKAVVDANNEKKKKKTSGGLARELRHLDVSSIHDPSDFDDNFSLSNATTSQKRRSRVAAKPPPSASTSQATPKLKIKIGSNYVQPVVEDTSGFQFRPPKKRLASIPTPCLEDLRRESMKYRRIVIAEFEKKDEKKRKTKGDKRKKKKEKKNEKLQVVNNREEPKKLIIRISRKKEEGGGGDVKGDEAPVPAAPLADPFDYDPSAPDPLAIDSPADGSSLRNVRTSKVTPIRLKIARSSQGSGYIMKDSPGEGTAPETDKR